jgi:hypothetical protein
LAALKPAAAAPAAAPAAARSFTGLQAEPVASCGVQHKDSTAEPHSRSRPTGTGSSSAALASSTGPCPAEGPQAVVGSLHCLTPHRALHWMPCPAGCLAHLALQYELGAANSSRGGCLGVHIAAALRYRVMDAAEVTAHLPTCLPIKNHSPHKAAAGTGWGSVGRSTPSRNFPQGQVWRGASPASDQFQLPLKYPVTLPALGCLYADGLPQCHLVR